MKITDLKLVIIESPYSGNVAVNVAYARRAVRHCINLGESPIASHLLFTQPGVLDDDNPVERAVGISAGLAWRSVCDYAVFFEDYGWSRGMLAAKQIYDSEGISWTVRKIGQN